MSAVEFQYRLYGSNDDEELAEMFGQSFGTRPHAGYFKWKYQDNPAGEAVAYVALHNGRIAAITGIMPEYYVIAGKREKIYQAIDAMTRPEYKGMGLFPRLARLCYDHVRQREGRLYLIAFPGPTSYKGFVHKLQWTELAKYRYLFTYRILHKWKNPAVKGIVEPAASFDDEFVRYFGERAKSGKPISKYWDRAVANWRFTAHTNIRYHLLKIKDEGDLKGFVLYHLDESNRAFIAGIDFADCEWSHVYLGHVCDYLFSKHSVYALYTFQSSPVFVQALKKQGFLSNPLPRGPFSYRISVVVNGDRMINGTDFFDHRNWDIQPMLRDF